MALHGTIDKLQGVRYQQVREISDSTVYSLFTQVELFTERFTGLLTMMQLWAFNK